MFERNGERVVVYVAWYSAQTQRAEMVNSENVLVTVADPRWRELAHGRAELPAQAAPIEARTATLKDTSGQFEVRWWYWVDGRTTTSDLLVKAKLAWTRLLHRSDDSAAVFIFTEPTSDPARNARAAETLAAFAADMAGQIDHALAATAAGASR